MRYQEVIDGINEVIDREIPLLLSLTEEQVSVKRNCQNRTVKMLVGHPHRLCLKQPPAHGAPSVCPSLRTLYAKNRDGYARLP